MRVITRETFKMKSKIVYLIGASIGSIVGITYMFIDTIVSLVSLAFALACLNGLRICALEEKAETLEKDGEDKKKL